MPARHANTHHNHRESVKGSFARRCKIPQHVLRAWCSSAPGIPLVYDTPPRAPSIKCWYCSGDMSYWGLRGMGYQALISLNGESLLIVVCRTRTLQAKGMQSKAGRYKVSTVPLHACLKTRVIEGSQKGRMVFASTHSFARTLSMDMLTHLESPLSSSRARKGSSAVALKQTPFSWGLALEARGPES